jgi:hypothetical protein
MEFQAQAQTLVRDILAYVLDGRIDEEARITYAGWITDAIETAVEATATELSEAVGCPYPTAHCAVGGPLGVAGPASAEDIRFRVEQLKDTLSQLFRWVRQAIDVVQEAYAVSADPAQLPTLTQALEQYRQARAALPEPSSHPPVLLALDEVIAALQAGDDRFGREIARLETLRRRLIAADYPLPHDLAGYRCVLFKDARPGDRPVALFERAVFAAQFIAQHPGRFREEDQTQDWLTLGDWLRLPPATSAKAADADGLTASIVAASYEFECEHCGEFSPVGEAPLPLYSTMTCIHCGAAHTVVSLPG